MADMITIMNTIHANASATYQERIPLATRENMDDIRFAMLSDENVQVANEFVSTLLNKLVKSVVITKRFQNPLKSLKKGKKPLGDTIEEIFNNFIKGKQFNPAATADELMQRHLPDTKTVYHRMNFKMYYPITISAEALQKAFKSWDALENYINDLIAQLWNSADLDEFVNMKQLLKAALDSKAMKTVNIPDPLTGEANAKEFIKAVKTVSGLMQFPNSDWNSYLTAQTDDTLPITTFSRKDEQILIIDTATDTAGDVIDAGIKAIPFL